MLNYNLNTLYTNRVSIEPILANDFNYFLIGGGGGGAAGSGGTGGNGGQGGEVITGSFSFPHLSTATLTIGGGGVGGTPLGDGGTAGATSSLSLQSSLISFANAGLPNFNTGSLQIGTQVGLQYDYFNASDWGEAGTKGGDAPSGLNGIGGGTISGIPGAPTTGGGSGGFRWDAFNGGGNLNAGSGLVVLSFLDPRDIYEYVGDWDASYYLNGRKYFYWLRIPPVMTVSVGTFTFLGQRDI